MRPTANFTLHALLAACLAALAATSAAAAPAAGKEQVYYTIILTDARVADGKGEQIEIQSFQWGPSAGMLDKPTFGEKFMGQLNKRGSVQGAIPAGGGANQVSADDTAGREKLQPGGGHASSDMVMKGSRIGQNSGRGVDIATVDGQPAGTVGGSEKITVDGTRTRSGQATGKRQHKPMVMRGYYDQAPPPTRGSLTVLASGTPCRVGARYPTLALSGGGKRYLLQDVSIASCAGAGAPEESITFVYGKVTVRGWDPATKQQ